MFVAACVQLRSTTDVQRNLAVAERLIRRAAMSGATLVVTPENTPFLGPQAQMVALAEDMHGPTVGRFAALAAELGIHLVLGSFAERIPSKEGAGRCYNTSVLLGPEGAVLASYRKMHLFDVDIPGGVQLRESASIAPGEGPVVADTPLGTLGFTICYDLRFPELFRAVVERGAQIILVPAAFTVTTGRDHWHALLRARAIETQSWVVAPGQWGEHDDRGRRHSYGHSLIVDPWGTVVADRGDGEGICLAEVDLERVDRIRAAIPVGASRRL